MKAPRKKTKVPAKVKPKAKTGTTTTRAARTMVKAAKKKAGAASPNKDQKGAAKRAKRDVKSLIEHLDVTLLSTADLTTISNHLNASLKLKNAIEKVGLAPDSIAAGYCYTKSAGDPIVSIWRDGFKVGSCTEQQAQANGITPCG